MIVHNVQLDSTICRFRRDYEVIDSDQDEHEDSAHESEEEKEEQEEEQKEEEVQPSENEVDNSSAQRPSDNSEFGNLIKTGKSNSNNDDSSEDSIEELEEDDIDSRPSFLDYGQDDEDSKQQEEPRKEDKKVDDYCEEVQPSQIAKDENGSFSSDANTVLEILKNIPQNEKYVEEEHKEVKIDPREIDIFGQKNIEHLEDDNEIKYEANNQNNDRIIINNQPFENHAIINRNEGHKEEEVMKSMIKKQDPKHRHKRQNVYEPVYAVKINKLAGNELPSESPFSFLANKIKTSLMGLTEEQADQLSRVDESYPEMSNLDVIIAKPGSVIKK